MSKIHLLEDDEYDLDDLSEKEYDLEALRAAAKEQGREYKGVLRPRRVVELDPDVAAFFTSKEKVNEVLRLFMLGISLVVGQDYLRERELKEQESKDKAA